MRVLLLFFVFMHVAIDVSAQFVPLPNSPGLSHGSRPVVLPNGDVAFLTGGSQVTIVDYRRKTFSTVQLPVYISYGASISALPDGRLLVLGGTDTNGTSKGHAFLSDAAFTTFQQVRGILKARTGHAAVTLNSGLVLVVGGDYDGTTLTATWESYDPSGARTVNSGSLPQHLAKPSSVFHHPGGKTIFLFGFKSLVFTESTATFVRGADMPILLYGSEVEMLADGRMFVSGGHDSSSGALRGIDTAYVYDVFSGQYETVERLLNARFWHAATRLPSGKVLITGGSDFCSGRCDNALDSPAEIFDPATKTIVSIENMAYPRHSHRGTRLLTGEILLLGGSSLDTRKAEAELYVKERWGRRRPVPRP